MRYWHWWPCIDPSWGALEWPLPWWCWQDLLDHLQRQRQRQRQSVRNTEAKLCRRWGVKFLFSDDRWSCQRTTNKLAMIFRVCVCMKLRIRLKNKKLRQFNRSSITKHHPKLWRKMCKFSIFSSDHAFSIIQHKIVIIAVASNSIAYINLKHMQFPKTMEWRN